MEAKKLNWVKPGLGKISGLLNRADGQGCINGSSDPDGCGPGGYATSGYCAAGGNVYAQTCEPGSNAESCNAGTWIH